MEASIELVGLRKQYGRRTAVDSLDLAVEAGAVFGLIGPNGAGKTTTLRMILDIIRPTSGTIRVFGEDPRGAGPALRRRIGFVPGELRLDGRATGRRTLDFYASVSGGVRPGAIDDLADRLDLDLNSRVHALSKGNRQKLGIVQAFMHEPPLLVLDEPTSGLDPLVQREFLRMVGEARERGQTVLLSSHVLSEIQQAADRVAVLNRGRIVAEGRVDALRLGTIRRIRAGIGGVGEDALAAQLTAVPQITEFEVREIEGNARVTATIEGDIDPVVKLIAAHRVLDLAVEEPDLAHGIGRVRYAAESAAAVLVRLLWLGVFAAAVVALLDDPAALDIDPVRIVDATAVLVGLTMLSGSSALFVGAASGRRSWGIAAGAGVAVAGYAFNAIANQAEGAEWLRAISPYSWAYHQPPLSEGGGPGRGRGSVGAEPRPRRREHLGAAPP